MKRYKVPRISVVMYLLEHVEIVNLVNVEGETPLYCATLLRDDRKLLRKDSSTKISRRV